MNTEEMYQVVDIDDYAVEGLELRCSVCRKYVAYYVVNRVGQRTPDGEWEAMGGSWVRYRGGGDDLVCTEHDWGHLPDPLKRAGWRRKAGKRASLVAQSDLLYDYASQDEIDLTVCPTDECEPIQKAMHATLNQKKRISQYLARHTDLGREMLAVEVWARPKGA